MASGQEEIVMNNKEKEIVKKMVEEAKNNFWSDNAINQQNSSYVAMTNSTVAMVTFSKYQNWEGKVRFGDYPGFIHPQSKGNFDHERGVNCGSKGAVLYLGTHAQERSCGWLLAWYAPQFPSNTNPNKVYVTCGPAASYNAVDWTQVLAGLDAAPPGGYARFTDIDTKTTINATIVPNNSIAIVGANFEILP